MSWSVVGSASFSPTTEEATVGPVTVPESGGLAVKVRLLTPAPFQFGYCLLSYRSAFGRELGTIRVWPRSESTVYKLGEGLSVMDTSGALVIEPRTWNLRWVEAGFPLSVQVLADVEAGLPADRFAPDGFASPTGSHLDLVTFGSGGLLDFGT
jgi:hypothetical protein